ncbi:MAG TPA: sigma-54 dependent transcriptional regulator [Sedimentisphaerales bacterium]|nr:sigma-54 dependent transcriptional regulator [Sedimentisphaerales bacterium]
MNLRRVVAVTKDAEIQQLARRVGQDIFVADDLNEALDIIETVNPDLILLDDWFGLTDIREFLSKSHKNSINTPMVVVGNEKNQTSSTEFIKMGVHDYLQGSQDYNRLELIADRLENKPKPIDSARSTSDFFAEDYAASVSMVGRSRAFVKTLAMIRLVAASRCNPVLIVGETGTGKELAAEAIHVLRHPNEQFVAVNCAALTANLLESELFGHEKGAFTGADREKTGLLELAGSGTILLDEISEVPIDLQTKLLRVLQEKTFRKVGGVKNINCDATIIATSNRNLYRETKANRFRRDLYYRLNICPVIITPLRSPDRREDISLLAEYFLKTSTICPEKTNKIVCLTKLAMEILEKHDWPGNVRELRNVIERAILLETTDKIGLSSIVIDPPEYCEQSENLVPAARDHIRDFSLAKAERELIARALQETGWQKTQAAALLGITRATLYAKVKQYNIEKGMNTAEHLQEHKNSLGGTAKELQDDVPISSSRQFITAAQ